MGAVVGRSGWARVLAGGLIAVLAPVLGASPAAASASLQVSAWERRVPEGSVHYSLGVSARQEGVCAARCTLRVEAGYQRPDGSWRVLSTLWSSTRSPLSAPWQLVQPLDVTVASGLANATHVRLTEQPYGVAAPADLGWAWVAADPPVPGLSVSAVLARDFATGRADYTVDAVAENVQSTASACAGTWCNYTLTLGTQGPDGSWRSLWTSYQQSHPTQWSRTYTLTGSQVADLAAATHVRAFARPYGAPASDPPFLDTGWVAVAAAAPAPVVNPVVTTWALDAATGRVDYALDVEALRVRGPASVCFTARCAVVAELGATGAGGAWAVRRTLSFDTVAWSQTQAFTASAQPGLGDVNAVRAYLRSQSGAIDADTGPLPLFAGGLDLVAAGALATTSGLERLCEELALRAPRDNPHSSVPTAALDCYAALGQGMKAAVFMARLARTAAGLVALISDTTQSERVPVYAPPDDDPTGPPVRRPDLEAAPVHPPDSPTWEAEVGVDRLTARLAERAEGTGYGDGQLRTIARQCLHLASLAALVPQTCDNTPIFVSGRDVPEATDHDLEALTGMVPDPSDAPGTYIPSTAIGYTLPPAVAGDPQAPPESTYQATGAPHFRPGWILQYWEGGSGSGKPNHRWYINHPTCLAGEFGDRLDCDEFPLFATEEGGRPAAATPHLRLVPETSNRSQGVRFQGWPAQCSLLAGTPAADRMLANSTGGSPLLFVPVPDGPVPVALTRWIC